jgi:glyceraldehyde 3-phosphate dehydrogenase
LRVAWDMPEAYKLVHFNDIAAGESIAYLIKHDSIHGTWKCDVEYKDGSIVITDGDRVETIAFSAEKDISKVGDAPSAWQVCQ